MPQERQGILAHTKVAGSLPISSMSKNNRFIIENKYFILAVSASRQSAIYENAEK
jgi:hypothetical protein